MSDTNLHSSHGRGALLVVIAGCLALTGCAVGGAASDGGTITGALPALPVLTAVSFPMFGDTAAGKPADVYVRIARLAKACWFASSAPLDHGYVFTAELDPESRGGAGRIVIFVHNLGESHGANAERGSIAYQVSLAPSGERTAILVENSRIAPETARRLKADIDRWAAGDQSCAAPVWSASATPSPIETSAGAADAKPIKALAR